MNQTRVLPLALLLLMSLSPWADAQPDSPAALRQTVVELEGRVAALRAQLATITAERDQLLAEIARLRAAIIPGSDPAAPRQEQAKPTDGARPSVPVSALSQDPLASPDALFVALLLDYRERFTTDPTAPKLPEPDAVREWTREMRSAYEGPTTWLVAIEAIVREQKDRDRAGGLRALATVLDTGTGTPISRPVMIPVPKRMEARFPESVTPGETLHAELRVKMNATPVFQASRETVGPFDYPPYIGPYAGFAYELDIVGLRFLDDSEIDALKQRPRGPVRR